MSKLDKFVHKAMPYVLVAGFLAILFGMFMLGIIYQGGTRFPK